MRGMKSFAEIISAAAAKGPKKLAIAGEPNEELGLALDRAAKESIAEAVFFQDAPTAAGAVRTGECDVLMKGDVSTKDFMRAILDKEQGLRSGKLISHVFVVEARGKLMLITDGGICINPTLEQKVEIIRNSIPIANAMGIATPKVAVLAAIETVNPKMPETLDAAELSKMDIPGCLVQGPLALDNAVSVDAARAKGISGPVAGMADVLLVPSVLCGNIFAKSISYFGECRVGGVAAGTSKPVTFLSRSDTADTKFHTIALGVLIS